MSRANHYIPPGHWYSGPATEPDSPALERLRDALDALPASTGVWRAVGPVVENECDELPDICGTVFAEGPQWPGEDEDACALASYIAACNPEAIRELLIRLDEARRGKAP